VTDDLKEKAIALSDAGQLAFERGNYRAAVTAFEQAVKLANPNTRLGGDISLWLVNAYAAANLPDKAIALCEVLTRHPHWDTRKQSKRLLYILKAPKLKLKAEWQTRIPDLSELENDGDRPLNLSRYPKLPPGSDPTPASRARTGGPQPHEYPRQWVSVGSAGRDRPDGGEFDLVGIVGDGEMGRWGDGEMGLRCTHKSSLA
jgi:tetratricopeptide (TPR) repeat protein